MKNTISGAMGGSSVFQVNQTPSVPTCWRVHGVDLAAMTALFLCVTLTAGRVFRFPFDDEIYTLIMIREGQTFGAMFGRLVGGFDVHPPLSYVLFFGLRALGLEEAGMRAVSLTLTAASLLLTHALTLGVLTRRNGGVSSPATRLLAVILFGLSPMAVNQGDALRWYPLFAFLVGLFLYLYLTARRPLTILLAAVPLGLAASTNFLAIMVAAPFAVHRYALERRFNLRLDALFWLIVGVCGAPGAITAWSIIHRGLGADVDAQVAQTIIRALGENFIGFFGGYSLGLSQIVAGLGLVATFAVAFFREISPRDRGAPTHLVLLLLSVVGIAALVGFGKARSFLYLAPMVSALAVLLIDRLFNSGRNALALVLATACFAGVAAATANASGSLRPYKRNMVIPYREILDFINLNQSGAALVVTNEDVMFWLLNKTATEQNRCVALKASRKIASCLQNGMSYEAVFVVEVPRQAVNELEKAWPLIVRDLTSGRRQVARIRFGYDGDAALKARFIDSALPIHLMEVTVYR